MPEPRIDTYYSCRTETLVAELCRHLITDESSPLHVPFQRTQIIVPNSGMQRYIELKIAERFGICSHIDISYAGSFLWQAYRNVLNNHAPAQIDSRLLTFTLLNHWQDNPQATDERLQALLQQYSQPRQRYMLATRIAQLLRQYLNERPAMIDAWQAGQLSSNHPHESWQRKLFLQLISTLSFSGASRNDLQQRFAAQLSSDKAYALPPVIHVFGFHALPATQLTDFFAIGQVAAVKFYTFNPSVLYWQDIVPEAVKTRAEMTAADEAALLSVGHPLLASWGQSGKYLIEQLNNYQTINHDETPTDKRGHSVLAWLQQSIQHLADDQTEILHKAFHTEQANNAPSISLHAAAGARREVETLYDNLCAKFMDGQINPADVLVIIPRLNDYAPHIQAVFSRSNIPFSLANQTSAESDQDVQAFLSLLSVIESDFQAQTLFECLHEQRIQDALAISQAELESLRHWFADSRYSLHFRDQSNGHSSSLEKLLDSLLLAYVGGEETRLDNRESAPFFHGEQQQTLHILCDLWQRFQPFAALRSRHLTLTQWLNELRRLADAFLPWRHGMDTHLNEWFDTIAEADSQSTHPFETVLADLSAVLQSEMLHGPFLSGGVSFCAVMPMRSIPAKIIAILGMNSDFPAVSDKDPLDIRQAHPQWSDKNLHKEQQYFFLETLMAARETLYLSHIGLDEQTGESIPPSALVRELFGYIERHLPDFGDTMTTHYPLQGFSAPDSYQTLYNTIASSDIIPDSQQTNDNQPTNSEQPTQLTSNQLADALHEPLSAYWRYHLGAVMLDTPAEPLAEHEFIAADSGLDKWQYRQTALATALQQQPETAAQKALQRHNLYAPPVISDALLMRAKTDITPLQSALQNLPLSQSTQAINALIKWPFDGRKIYLRVRANQDPVHGLVHYHVGTTNVKKQLRAWVTHVLYHCQTDAKPSASLLLTLDKGKVTRNDFAPLSNGEAHSALTAMLALFSQLITQPYTLALEAGKKGDENRFVYRKKVYPLYPKIPVANAEMMVLLQALWQPIEEIWMSSKK